MNFFKAIEFRRDQLDELGQAYLDKFEFIPSPDMADRIYAAAGRIFKAANKDWAAVPEWVASCMDGWVPYTPGTRDGSLYHALAFSVVSQDAHLRNLMEIAEGRETKPLDFAIIAEREIVLRLCDPVPESKS